MKICFFSPYLPQHAGGGEKHLFDVANIFAEKHQVFIAVSEQFLKGETLASAQSKYERFYGRSLNSFQFITTPLFSNASFFTKLKWTGQFDALYYVTDGSLFLSLAPKNLLHIQVPFTGHLSISNRFKLLQWGSINVNSAFTQSIIAKTWGQKKTTLLYPLIEKKIDISSRQPEKLILAVGRFFKGLHTKRQDILIDTFKRFKDRFPEESKGWKLVLAGSCEDTAYLEELKIKAAGLPVTFAVGISRDELDDLYTKASFFWHASGYGVDETAHPEQVEHFGITTVEALAAGVVPLVVGKGGQKEILNGELAELQWNDISECVEKTRALINDSKRYAHLQELGYIRANDFGKDRFTQQVHDFFGI